MSSPKKTKTATPDKDKKPKLVRDSFTIPKNEYAALDSLKTRALAAGVAIKKSELLRAGLMALGGMSDVAFKSALAAVPTLKTGRPTQQASKKAPAAEGTVAAAPAKKVAAGKTTAPAKKPSATAKAAPRAAKKAAVKTTAAAPAKAKPAAQPAVKAPAAPARRSSKPAA